MGEATKIEWCDHTFNPWWGCVRVSPGCEHCYAEAFAKRIGQKVWGVQSQRRFFGDKHWAEPRKWNAQAAKDGVRRRVFCASMGDVFEDREDLRPHRARLFSLIEATPSLDWLLLTKRPENADRLWSEAHVDTWNGADSLGLSWLPNIWLGTTIEDKTRARRIYDLVKVPAAVRFLSCEPLLQDIATYLEMLNVSAPWAGGGAAGGRDYSLALGFIDWIIIGGESGHKARPFAIEWAERLIDLCRHHRIACFMKQLGAFVVSEQRTAPEDMLADPGTLGPEMRAKNGEYWAWRAGLTDRKGADVEQWPDLLNVRQWPEARHG